MEHDFPEVEYSTFFPNHGSFSIEVKFNPKGASVSKKHASVEDVARLLNFLATSNQPVMTFDDQPGVVTGIQIDPIRKTIILSILLQQ